MEIIFTNTRKFTSLNSFVQLLIYDDYSLPSRSVIDDIPDQTVTTGLNVTFNCSAEGSTAISYRWRRTELGSLVERGFDDVIPNRVLGETTATLTILNVGVLDEGEYTCFVNVSGTLVGTRTASLTTQGEYQWDNNCSAFPVIRI